MESVRFVEERDIRARVAEALAVHGKRLKTLIPDCLILHIGSTAIPGSLTKGDLDILVRVPAHEMAEADRRIASWLSRNTGNRRTEEYSSFSDDSLDVPLGVQLVAVGSAIEREFLDAQAALAEHVLEYNTLKRSFEGKSMDEYRSAKWRLIQEIMARRPDGEGAAH